jgi:hypothetical protein
MEVARLWTQEVTDAGKKINQIKVLDLPELQTYPDQVVILVQVLDLNRVLEWNRPDLHLVTTGPAVDLAVTTLTEKLATCSSTMRTLRMKTTRKTSVLTAMQLKIKKLKFFLLTQAALSENKVKIG